MMKITKPLLAALFWSLALCVGVGVGVAAQGAAAADAPSAKPAAASAGAYTEKGADTCLQCHSEETELAIFKTKHAQRGDKRTPFAGTQCETCHGPGAKHAEGGDATAINSLKANSVQTPGERNKVCLDCHRGNSRTGWHASTHESNNLACTSCHKLHAERDPVLVKATEPEVCYNCHKKQRADFTKTSVHPVRFAKMACSECHSAHGSTSAGMLVKQTVNQTCFTCHAEKRGPFLWEHAPAAEDCTLCHTPHGSVYAALLKKNAPLLCQQCHTVSGHPSVARTPAGLPGGSAGASGFLLAGSCMNCHSQVHGSNHPSGVKLMR